MPHWSTLTVEIKTFENSIQKFLSLWEKTAKNENLSSGEKYIKNHNQRAQAKTY